MELQDFLDYFLSPKKTGYDIPKTLTYGLILIVAVYLIFKILKKLNVKIDRRLVLAISPYIIFGSSLRVLEDLGLISGFIFVTPGIYFLGFFILFFVLAVSLFLEKKRKIPYFKTLFTVGLLLAAFVLTQFKPVNSKGLLLVIIYFIPWFLIFGYFLKRWSLSNRMVSSVQMFDATVTFVSLSFFGQKVLGLLGFIEQHVVPTFIINLFGPISFLIVKVIAVISVLILIDKFSDDKEFNTYLKLVIGILGAATGTRDFIALLTLL